MKAISAAAFLAPSWTSVYIWSLELSGLDAPTLLAWCWFWFAMAAMFGWLCAGVVALFGWLRALPSKTPTSCYGFFQLWARDVSEREPH